MAELSTGEAINCPFVTNPGIDADWASEKHHAPVNDYHGKRIGERVFSQSGAGISQMAASLASVMPAEPSEIRCRD